MLEFGETTAALGQCMVDVAGPPHALITLFHCLGWVIGQNGHSYVKPLPAQPLLIQVKGSCQQCLPQLTEAILRAHAIHAIVRSQKESSPAQTRMRYHPTNRVSVVQPCNLSST